ncbi:uncharacterized protein [Paralichthys olivaceus]|uniref:uncharacterized protein isoform X2 n=1 Tax=Paralichthys olivaceus TaxID=8255 RepID=UPI003752B402
MESVDTRPPSNDSRCVFFNAHTEDYRCVVILTVKRATGTISLAGCLFMLFVIWLLRRYHSLAQKMILSLTVAAFFDSVAYVMGESHPEGSLCAFQAWWLTYFDWSSLAWVCLITLNLYLNLVRETSTNRFEMFYHLVAWGVPLVMASLPLLKGYYGPAGAWCWITDDHVAWRFGIVSSSEFSEARRQDRGGGEGSEEEEEDMKEDERGRRMESRGQRCMMEMVCAAVQPDLSDDLLLRQDHLRGQCEVAVMVGNLQPREGETKGFVGRGDQAIEVVSLRLPAGVNLSPHQQAPQCLLPTGSVLLPHLVARPVGATSRLGQCLCLWPGSGLVESIEPHRPAAGSAVAAV